MNYLNIENLNRENNNTLPLYIENEPQSAVRSTSNITPNQAGILFGSAKVIGDLCASGNTLSNNLVNSVVTHFVAQSGIRLKQGTQVPVKFNYISSAVKDLISNSFGGMCGMVSQKATEILAEQGGLSKENAKLLKDFVLLCGFVSTELHANKFLGKLDNFRLMQDINQSPQLEMRNISNKSIKFFVDVMSGAMGSLAISYIMPLVDSGNNTYIDSAKNGAIAGSIFMMAKTLTHNSLTKLYNKCTGQSL